MRIPLEPQRVHPDANAERHGDDRRDPRHLSLDTLRGLVVESQHPMTRHVRREHVPQHHRADGAVRAEAGDDHEDRVPGRLVAVVEHDGHQDGDCEDDDHAHQPHEGAKEQV